MTGITHPEGCLCEGCVRARESSGSSCAPEASPCQGSGVGPGRGGSSCPAAGGPCFCTGACRGEAQGPDYVRIYSMGAGEYALCAAALRDDPGYVLDSTRNQWWPER